MKSVLAKLSRLLFVEDEAEIRELALEILTPYFQDVTVAMNGVEAIEKLNAQEFDVVVTDYRMPKMNGIELISWMSKHRPQIPVLMLTGNGQEKEVQEAVKCGAFDVLDKPMRPAILIQRIQNSLIFPFYFKTLAATIGLEMGEGKMNEFTQSDFEQQLKILHAYSELIKIKAMNKNIKLIYP